MDHAMSTETKASMEFKTELNQLLHLITHSLYSNREIFLRELISNASDAINKIRFDSISREDLLEGDRDWKITITPDKVAKTLTISDNGVGMDRDTVIENLGTIAKSGTKGFLEALKQQNAVSKPDLIGQFGVGFYSSFMVADKVVVTSRMMGHTEAVRWESDGQGTFDIEPATREKRGTDIVLHLKEDALEYLETWQISGLVKKFSDYVEFPIVMKMEAEEGKEPTEETINSRVALWLRSKNEVKPEEYDSFYQNLSGDFEKPLSILHYNVEGNLQYKVLMFIPAKRPMTYQWEEPKGLQLYIQRVSIMDSCEGLLPTYLRFVRGIVDSADLPLNISREILQQNAVLDKMQKGLVRNILEELDGMKNTQRDKYKPFFAQFGDFIKEGLSNDWSNKEKLADLLLFESLNTAAGELTTLADYIAKMPEEQKEIYYLIGESREFLSQSPLLEAFKKKNYDVLLMISNMDEYMITHLNEFKGKKLVAVDRGTLPNMEAEAAPDASAYQDLFKTIKEILPDVADVRLSNRLQESVSCLVADGAALTANRERLLQRMGRMEQSEMTNSKRIFELNPNHPVVGKLQTMYATDAKDPKVEDTIKLLYDQAVLAEGSRVKDLTGFLRRINELIAK